MKNANLSVRNEDWSFSRLVVVFYTLQYNTEHSYSYMKLYLNYFLTR